MILTNITDSFYNIKAMIEDCEGGGTIRCCVDGFVVWVFDFFLLIICHLRAQLCLELLAIFKISSFYFMVHAKPYGLLVIKVGQCQQPERQWNRLSSGRRSGLHGCIFYSLFIGTSWFDSTHTYMEFLYIAWEYVGCFGRKLDTLICIIYISTPSAILNFCSIANC